jgi:hypothetical protein
MSSIMLTSQIYMHFWKIWMLRWRLIVLWKQNIKISAKGNLCYYELRKHKPGFDEGMFKIIRSKETSYM